LFVPVLQPALPIEGVKSLTPYEQQLKQLNENLGIGVTAHFDRKRPHRDYRAKWFGEKYAPSDFCRT
jgi:hypothetical protein